MQFYTLFPNSAERAVEPDFETLFEADSIVNLFEGYYPAEKAGACYRNGVRTAFGKLWFARLFPGCAGVG